MTRKIRFDMKKYLEELRYMSNTHSQKLEELSNCSNYYLKRRRTASGSWYYYAVDKKTNCQNYLGVGNTDGAERIKEYRFFKKSKSIIDENIVIIEHALSKLNETAYENINQMLPDTYKDANIMSVSTGDKRAKAWKERAEALKSRYDTYRPDELIIKTNDGSMVRSKSEAMIYNYLLSVGVNFVYELPLKMRTGTLRPDFVLLSEQDYKTEIIIEHQGMISDDYYRKRFAEKVYRYIQDGYVQGINIFFTFDSINGGFDKTPIEDIVRNKIKV